MVDYLCARLHYENSIKTFRVMNVVNVNLVEERPVNARDQERLCKNIK